MGCGLCLSDHPLDDLIRLARIDLFPSLWEEYKECGHLKKCYSYREACDVVRILNIMLKHTSQYRGGRYSIFWAVDQGRNDGKTEDYSL